MSSRYTFLDLKILGVLSCRTERLISERQAAIRCLRPGDPLSFLVGKPGKFDNSGLVRVSNVEGLELGWLRPERAGSVAAAMRSGAHFQVSVNKQHTTGYPGVIGLRVDAPLSDATHALGIAAIRKYYAELPVHQPDATIRPHAIELPAPVLLAIGSSVQFRFSWTDDGDVEGAWAVDDNGDCLGHIDARAGRAIARRVACGLDAAAVYKGGVWLEMHESQAERTLTWKRRGAPTLRDAVAARLENGAREG